MTHKPLNIPLEFDHVKNFNKAYDKLVGLLKALETKDLPAHITDTINLEIDQLNASQKTGKSLRSQIKKATSRIMKLVEKELKLVPRNYYRNQWMALGMLVYGIPIGIALSASLDNYAFMGAFLPVGMVIGMSMGAQMDKKAASEGRQLDVDA